MSVALLEAFRHSGWATELIIEACKQLSPEQLAAPGLGGFGGIIETLGHLVWSDGHYLRALTEDAPGTFEDTSDLDVLLARWRESQQAWDRFLSAPVDADRLLLHDEGTYEAQASVSIVQALHHASVHREQVSAMLTAMGVETPDLEPWEWALVAGRARFLT